MQLVKFTVALITVATLECPIFYWLLKSHGSVRRPPLRDGKRRVDYVIVFKGELLSSLTSYCAALQFLGLNLEAVMGKTVQKYFLLLHIPQPALVHFSKVYDVGNTERKVNLPRFRPWRSFRPRQTPISYISDKEKGTFTSAERIIIIHKLLESTKYGDELGEIGISKLIKLKLVEDAYPLHDGTKRIDKNNLMYANDRQLLMNYWSNFRVCFKEQPLDMIQRYFGSEVAFYFAWLEFFNTMLLPAAFMGTLVFIVNLIIVLVFPFNEITETCNANDIWICPTCEFQKQCSFSPLSSYCDYARWTHMFDNYLTITFAVLMSFWATLFMNLWRRKQTTLLMKWGILFQKEERFERRFDLVSRRSDRISRKLENILRMTFAVSVCFFMILLVLAAVVGVIMFKINITIAMKTGDIGYFQRNGKLVAMVAGSILQVVFIKIFGKMYGKLSIYLTNFENLSTQADYDSSVLHKRYLLSFANNYAALFYLAFLKGRFFFLPHQYKSSSLQRDTCQPSTCTAALSMQLAFLMLLKKLAGNILTLLFPKLKHVLTRLKNFCIRKKDYEELPLYEEDYRLLPTNRYLLTTEFCEMVIEYGLVTFFVAAFPLAPLFALLNNLLEIRLDAYKLVKRYRRPVPRQVAGIGSWDGIMTGLTYFSTATNAFVIAFTSDFIGREIYRKKNNYFLKGYVNSTLSQFATKDYNLYEGIPPNPDFCYYNAMRYPPNHPNKYQLTGDFWMDIMWKCVCVLIFEHIILAINGMLSFAIPDMPLSVKQQLHIDKRLAKEAKLKLLNDEMKQGKNKGTGINKFQKDPFDHDRKDGRKSDGKIVETGPIGGFLNTKDK